MATKGKIILFGKTGAGKSTVANVLANGKIDDTQFPVSDGLTGCTSELKTSQGRGWEITDTVGLGESTVGTVEHGEAEQKVLEFLTRVKGKYSHIVYVKSSEERFDIMDEHIWKTFTRVFKGAEEAFVILLTRASEDWLDNNFGALPLWAQSVGRAKVLVADMPPYSDRPKAEQRNKSTRESSIAKLEADLLQLVPPAPDMYSVPDICNMNSEDLEEESKSILGYIMSLVTGLVTRVRNILSPSHVMESVFAILGL